MHLACVSLRGLRSLSFLKSGLGLHTFLSAYASAFLAAFCCCCCAGRQGLLLTGLRVACWQGGLLEKYGVELIGSAVWQGSCNPNRSLHVACRQGGLLEKYGVELIGAKLPSINKAEDRELFKQAMKKIGLKTPPSGTVETWEDALKVRQRTSMYILGCKACLGVYRQPLSIVRCVHGRAITSKCSCSSSEYAAPFFESYIVRHSHAVDSTVMQWTAILGVGPVTPFCRAACSAPWPQKRPDDVVGADRLCANAAD